MGSWFKMKNAMLKALITYIISMLLGATWYIDIAIEIRLILFLLFLFFVGLTIYIITMDVVDMMEV